MCIDGLYSGGKHGDFRTEIDICSYICNEWSSETYSHSVPLQHINKSEHPLLSPALPAKGIVTITSKLSLVMNYECFVVQGNMTVAFITNSTYFILYSSLQSFQLLIYILLYVVLFFLHR